MHVAQLQPLRNQRTALLNTLDRLLGTMIMTYRKTLCLGNLNLRYISRLIDRFILQIHWQIHLADSLVDSFLSLKILLIYKDNLVNYNFLKFQEAINALFITGTTIIGLRISPKYSNQRCDSILQNTIERSGKLPWIRIRQNTFSRETIVQSILLFVKYITYFQF